MSNENDAAFDIHEDADLFAEAINFTAATTGFAARLIEKDYFASVLLRPADFAAFARVVALAGRVD